MSFFKNLKLENFRNFNIYDLDLSNGCNILYGKNGAGKTNILESISLFEKGSGLRKDKIENLININSNKKNFTIEAVLDDKNNELNLLISNKFQNDKQKKIISVNGSITTESIKYFHNIFSIISFLPEMERLFLISPSNRRNFFDRLIYSADKDYIKNLNQYKKKILERFNILKNDQFDIDWINKIEEDIVNMGMIIYEKKLKQIEVLNKYLKKLEIKQKSLYKINLNLEDEIIKIYEKSPDKMKEFFMDKIKENRKIDALIGGSKVGPHKTDIAGLNILTGQKLNQFSTGQQKTVVLLIIISQCTFLINELSIKPIILFDEVCSHLDDFNREILLSLIESLDVQTIMTGTEQNFFSFLSTKASYCNITENK